MDLNNYPKTTLSLWRDALKRTQDAQSSTLLCPSWTAIITSRITTELDAKRNTLDQKLYSDNSALADCIVATLAKNQVESTRLTGPKGYFVRVRI